MTAVEVTRWDHGGYTPEELSLKMIELAAELVGARVLILLGCTDGIAEVAPWQIAAAEHGVTMSEASGSWSYDDPSPDLDELLWAADDAEMALRDAGCTIVSDGDAGCTWVYAGDAPSEEDDACDVVFEMGTVVVYASSAA